MKWIRGMALRDSKRQEYLNLPNYLSFARILLVPVVMVLLVKISPLRTSEYNLWVGLIVSGVFIIAGVSDLIDGYYARKYNIDSVVGKYLDPLADKLMILAVMVMLIPLERIPAWMVVIFLAREITITALRGVATAEGLVIPADQWGKKKTLLQNISLVALMIHYPLLGINTQKFGMIVLVMALILSLGSGYNYLYQFFQEIKKKYPKT